jgi:hypothetical protein
VVFRDREAIALLVFDVAAPGDAEFDLACSDRRRSWWAEARTEFEQALV